MILHGQAGQKFVADGGRWVDVPDVRDWQPEKPVSLPMWLRIRLQG